MLVVCLEDECGIRTLPAKYRRPVSPARAFGARPLEDRARDQTSSASRLRRSALEDAAQRIGGALRPERDIVDLGERVENFDFRLNRDCRRKLNDAGIAGHARMNLGADYVSR
jgi:hypothetical protein